VGRRLLLVLLVVLMFNLLLRAISVISQLGRRTCSPSRGIHRCSGACVWECPIAGRRAGNKAERLHLPTYLPTEGILHHLLSPSGRISVGAVVCMKERESSSSNIVTVCR
jgi:hypothetical protein